MQPVALAVALLLFCSADAPKEKVAPAKLPLIPVDRYLVRARCESASPWSVTTRYTMRIEHVYVGDAKLRGRTFDFLFYRGQLSSLGGRGIRIRRWESDRTPLHAVDFDPIKKGEVGIWWIGPDPNDGKELIAALSLPQVGNPKKERLFYCFPPALPGDKAEATAYDDGLQAAQMYERVVRADAKERVVLLKKYSAGKNSFAAQEAIELLVRLKAPDLVPFLIRLVEEKSTDFPRKWFVEYNFYGDKEWIASSARRKILQEVMEKDLRSMRDPTLKDDLRIAHHITILLQMKQLDFLFSVKLLVSGLANPARSRGFKDYLLRSIKGLSQRDAKSSAAGLDYLLGQIADSPDLNRKRAAAQSLILFTPLPAEKVPVVEKMRDQARDFTLRQGLSRALRPPKPQE